MNDDDKWRHLATPLEGDRMAHIYIEKPLHIDDFDALEQLLAMWRKAAFDHVSAQQGKRDAEWAFREAERCK